MMFFEGHLYTTTRENGLAKIDLENFEIVAHAAPTSRMEYSCVTISKDRKEFIVGSVSQNLSFFDVKTLACTRVMELSFPVVNRGV
jgi:hypothetical protein